MKHNYLKLCRFFASPIGVGANKQKPLVAIRRVDVSPIGFEPMTASLEGRCSIQLSYEPILVYKMVSFAAANIQIILKKDCFLN